MSLVQQFLEQNLTKDLNHQLLAQIQQQNSAVQSLVINLQGLRDKSNLEFIANKIKRMESFIQLKKQVVTTLQPLNANTSAIFQWILGTLVENSFLYELVRRQQFFVQKQLIEIGKHVLLEENYLQHHHEDTQFFNKIVRQLYSLNQEKGSSLKNFNHQKIKEVDYGMQLVEQKIKQFQAKVLIFNTQMIMFLRKLYSFDEKLKNQFYQFFKSQNHVQPQTPVSIKKGFNRQKSQKSHISIDSNKQSKVKIVRPDQFYEGQRTPRKFLETQIAQQMQGPYERKSVVQRKWLTLDERKPIQIREIKSSIHQNLSPVVDIPKVGLDYYRKRRPSQKYQPSPSRNQDELKSMNKTLSTLNYYNRPQTMNMLYTTSNLGQQVRLPSKWVNNSRSTLSYYQPR